MFQSLIAWKNFYNYKLLVKNSNSKKLTSFIKSLTYPLVKSYEEQAQFFAESVQEAEEQFHTLPRTDAEEGEISLHLLDLNLSLQIYF